MSFSNFFLKGGPHLGKIGYPTVAAAVDYRVLIYKTVKNVNSFINDFFTYDFQYKYGTPWHILGDAAATCSYTENSK